MSEAIVRACKKISGLFGSQEQLRYQDLLPFVLDDDGNDLIVFDKDRKRLLEVQGASSVPIETFHMFAIDILQTFSSDTTEKMNLDSWVYLKTKRHSELKQHLSEFGFKAQSDWSLMNRARVTQIEQLSSRDRHLLESFHAVYRRDRCRALTPCLPPTESQLNEMKDYLYLKHLTIETETLIVELKAIATQLRQYDIWKNRESLEIYCSESGVYVPRRDLPYQTFTALDIEVEDMREFLTVQLTTALDQSIEKKIQDHMNFLCQSKAYSTYSSLFIPGLLLYYEQGIPLKEISARLKMKSWDQARRILNPGKLLSQIRVLTIQQMLSHALKKAEQMGLTSSPPEPEYLQNLIEQIEAFADAEIFQVASEELRVGKKSRAMTSAYGHQLRLFLNNYSTPNS